MTPDVKNPDCAVAISRMDCVSCDPGSPIVLGSKSLFALSGYAFGPTLIKSTGGTVNPILEDSPKS